MKVLTYLGAAVLLCISSITMAGEGKIDICHTTGNGSIVVLNIPEEKANGHFLEHSDLLPHSMYACPENQPGCEFGDPLSFTLSCEDSLYGYSSAADLCTDQRKADCSRAGYESCIVGSPNCGAELSVERPDPVDDGPLF